MIDMELKEAQKFAKEIKELLDQKSNLKWNGFALLADLQEEIGELAETIKSLEGFKPYKKISKDNLGKELGDILFSLLAIANHYGVLLDDEFRSKVEEYKKRFL